MSKLVNALDGLTLKDLMSGDGLIIEMDEEVDDKDRDHYAYNPNPNLTDTELIKMLNMEEFAEDDDDNRTDPAAAMAPWSLSFDKIRAKSQDLTNDGKVMKLIKQDGVGDLLPPHSLVTVHYSGYIEHQDEPFDSTFRRGKPDRLRLNQGEILPGLEFGLLTMRKHEIACFILHHEYAYRELGCLPTVPPNAEILFIVHVLDFVDEGSIETLQNLSPEDRKLFKNVKTRAAALIKTAAESFKLYKVRQAIREYTRAANMLEAAKLDNDEEEEEMKRLLSKAYGNLAVCFNKEDKPRMACKSCLNVPNPTAKTYFHHGRALIKIGEYRRALEELQRSLRIEPNNKTTIKEIQLANTLQRKFLDTEKRLWKNCLNERSNEEAVGEHTAMAKEFCETFINNDAILRQPLPEGLTPKEDQSIREEAAKLGLNIVKSIRYEKDTWYLAKSRY